MLGSPASALHPPTPTPTPKQADIWSYGVLVWELASGQDITHFQPLAMARQMQAGGVSGAVGCLAAILGGIGLERQEQDTLPALAPQMQPG